MTSKFIESGIGHTLFSFDGRLSREPFWLYGIAIPWVLCWGIVLVVELVEEPQFGGSGALDGLIAVTTFVLMLFAMTTFLWIFLATTTKRLHDRDMSGWWVWLFLIPYVGLLILLVICALPGCSGENEYGPELAKV